MVSNKNFMDDVNAQADQVIEQIHKEIEAYEKDEINLFKAGLEKEIDSYYEDELNGLRLDSQTAISQDKLDLKRKLLKMRTDLAKQLFDEAEKQLVAFVGSKEYKPYLLALLAKHKDGYQDGYFEVKAADVKAFAEVLEEAKLTAEVKAGNIKIGGFKFISQKNHILLDETLDAKLLEQESWFMDHSGFIL